MGRSAAETARDAERPGLRATHLGSSTAANCPLSASSPAHLTFACEPTKHPQPASTSATTCVLHALGAFERQAFACPFSCTPASPPCLPLLHSHTPPPTPQSCRGLHPHPTVHMSEVQSRPARGRSSARGGRGGHGARGPRSNKQTNGDHTAAPAIDTSADQGELGELKRRYQSQLTTLKELFPDWTDVDLLLTVEESDGDLQATIEKITEGEHPCMPLHTTHFRHYCLHLPVAIELC